MDITKLFESLDEKVFTPEVKEVLQEQFNEAVQLKAEEIATDRISSEIDRLDEKVEEYTQMLEEKADEYVQQVNEETLQKVSEYLDLVVEQFVKEANTALKESAKSEYADMLASAFDSMLVAAGMEFSDIVESKEKTEPNSDLMESNRKIDELAEEVIELRKENDRLVQMGVIAEMSSGLSLIQQERFKRLASIVEYKRDPSYADQLQTILESVTSPSVEKTEVIEESKRETSTSSWAHLI